MAGGRRLFPLLATGVLVVVGLSTSVWGPELLHKTAWALPDDLWGTMTAAQRLARLHLAGLYTRPTGLISFPGAAVILVPVVLLMDGLGVPLAMQSAANPQPQSWLFAGPYQIVISGVVLFAADALAERLGVSRPRRFLLCVAQAVALWSVSIRWGHPEDAVALGLLLYAILALSRGREAWAGWLAGAAIAVQPLVLLAVPVLLGALGGQGAPGRQRAGALWRAAGFCARAAAPAALMLGAAAVANWDATIQAVTNQPNFPSIDHPTPWTALAPHLAGGNVAAGPGRVLAIVFACGCGAAFWYRWRMADMAGARDADRWAGLLWWGALALAMRSVFESVMVAYYLWPVLVLALVAASVRLRALLAAGVAATAVTFASQLSWRSPWGWWGLMLAGLAVTLLAAYVRPAAALAGGGSRVDDGQAPGRRPAGRWSAGRPASCRTPTRTP